MNDLKLVPLNKNHKIDFLKFSDQFIGKNYFNERNFKKQITLSKKNDLNSSFVLTSKENNIVGIRLTYAPGTWLNNINTRFIKDSKIDLSSIAYFKSLFIDPDHQKKGLGPLLSKESIKVLKKMGATHILSHSWMESPNNSSVRYLEKSGFKSLGIIPNFWADVDYLCSGCLQPVCQCTSVEMLYKI